MRRDITSESDASSVTGTAVCEPAVKVHTGDCQTHPAVDGMGACTHLACGCQQYVGNDQTSGCQICFHSFDEHQIIN